MERTFFILGTLSAFIAVAAGAFGAHTLKTQISTEMLVIFETAARYQMYHAVALIVAAWANTRFSGSLATIAGYLFVVGTIVFCGSLYALSLTEIKWLGAITPLGGVAFLSGWLCLAYAAWRS
ncbi:MAG: DUF423 domain-containing protein [Pyrinomonadaceae bacterium]|nr:DUF423 domain-containing protein [Pyrinomonadaceae bacterium]